MYFSSELNSNLLKPFLLFWFYYNKIVNGMKIKWYRNKGKRKHIIWTRDFYRDRTPRNLHIFIFFSRLISRKGLRFSYSYLQDVVYARGRRKSIHLGGYDVPAISTSRRFIETPWEFYRGAVDRFIGAPAADCGPIQAERKALCTKGGKPSLTWP